MNQLKSILEKNTTTVLNTKISILLQNYLAKMISGIPIRDIGDLDILHYYMLAISQQTQFLCLVLIYGHFRILNITTFTKGYQTTQAKKYMKTRITEASIRDIGLYIFACYLIFFQELPSTWCSPRTGKYPQNGKKTKTGITSHIPNLIYLLTAFNKFDIIIRQT